MTYPNYSLHSPMTKSWCYFGWPLQPASWPMGGQKNNAWPDDQNPFEDL